MDIVARPFRITIGGVVVPGVALALGDRLYSDNPSLSLVGFLEARSATGRAELRAATKNQAPSFLCLLVCGRTGRPAAERMAVEPIAFRGGDAGNGSCRFSNGFASTAVAGDSKCN
jgi:hypothetical protein